MKISLNNLGTVNKNEVTIETDKAALCIIFSYQTPVCFWSRGHRVTRQNDWGQTTGKLLNECEPDKSKRITGEQFEKELETALNKLLTT